MAKAKLVINVGPTYEGDFITFYLNQQQIGCTALNSDNGNAVFAASTLQTTSAQNFKGCVDDWLTALGFTSLYTVTLSSNKVTIEAVNDGPDYNLGPVEIYDEGTQIAGAYTTPFSVFSITNGTDPPPCCVSINSATSTEDDGSSNGTVTITNLQTSCSGGTPTGFESRINVESFVSGKTFWDNLPAGNYTIRVRLIANTTCFDDYFISVPNQTISCDLDITGIVTSPTNGTDNGTVTITATTSASPDNLEYRLDGGSWQSSNQFTGLTNKQYTLEVRDDLGCTVQEIFTILFVQPVPVSKFDPAIVIAPGIPYRFVLDKVSSEFLPDNVLYCEQQDKGLFKKTYTHFLGCSDRLTVHLLYIDNLYGTVPRLRIRDYKTDAQIGSTLQMSRVGNYYYLITELSTIANICEKVVYLEIISHKDLTEYYVHAKSEPITITNKEIQPNLYVRYSNGVDYAGIKYQGSVYYNEIRLKAQLRMIAPKIDTDKYRKSNGEEILLKSNTQYVHELTTDYIPDFMHRKLALAFTHKTVSIAGVEYVIEEPYTFDLVDRFALSKGRVVLIEKQNFQQNLI